MKRILVFSITMLVIGTMAGANLPSTFRVQGKVTDGSGNPVIISSVKYQLGVVPTDDWSISTPTWPLSWSDPAGISTSAANPGLFEVEILATPDTFQKNAIKFKINDSIETPHQLITSVPYAYRAKVAEAVVGGAEIELPYAGSANVPGATFKITNTNTTSGSATSMLSTANRIGVWGIATGTLLYNGAGVGVLGQNMGNPSWPAFKPLASIGVYGGSAGVGVMGGGTISLSSDIYTPLATPEPSSAFIGVAGMGQSAGVFALGTERGVFGSGGNYGVVGQGGDVGVMGKSANIAVLGTGTIATTTPQIGVMGSGLKEGVIGKMVGEQYVFGTLGANYPEDIEGSMAVSLISSRSRSGAYGQVNKGLTRAYLARADYVDYTVLNKSYGVLAINGFTKAGLAYSADGEHTGVYSDAHGNSVHGAIIKSAGGHGIQATTGRTNYDAINAENTTDNVEGHLAGFAEDKNSGVYGHANDAYDYGGHFTNPEGVGMRASSARIGTDNTVHFKMYYKVGALNDYGNTNFTDSELVNKQIISANVLTRKTGEFSIWRLLGGTDVVFDSSTGTVDINANSEQVAYRCLILYVP